jgi:hypothetical protein
MPGCSCRRALDQGGLAGRRDTDVRWRSKARAERVNARLKDEFGGRFVRVRGAIKVILPF